MFHRCCPKEKTSEYNSPEINKQLSIQEFRKKLRCGIPPTLPKDYYTDNLLKEVKKILEDYCKSTSNNICYE